MFFDQLIEQYGYAHAVRREGPQFHATGIEQDFSRQETIYFKYFNVDDCICGLEALDPLKIGL